MKFTKNKILSLIILLVICINSISLSKYSSFWEGKAMIQVSKPIVILEKDEILKTEITEKSFPMEYDFSICNYDESKVNEAEFDYVIQIEDSVEDFPISYKLIDCDNQEEIQLIEGKSQPMKIKSFEKEIRKFKLCFEWRELDRELADSLKIKLKVDVVQSRKGEEV